MHILDEIIVISIILVLSISLARLVGRYMAKVYLSEKSLLDWMIPAEKVIFRLCKALIPHAVYLFTNPGNAPRDTTHCRLQLDQFEGVCNYSLE